MRMTTNSFSCWIKYNTLVSGEKEGERLGLCEQFGGKRMKQRTFSIFPLTAFS